MQRKFYVTLILFLLTASLFAQQPDKKMIRIVDSMTIQEKNSRNPLILRSELDSMIKQFNASQVQLPVQEPVKEEKIDYSGYILIALIIVVGLLAWLLFLFYVQQKKMTSTMAALKRQVEYTEMNIDSPHLKEIPDMAKEKISKSKMSTQALENKINDLNAELQKVSKENEKLNLAIKEYNGIQHEYDSLKHGLAKTYKIKNYPGYEKNKAETIIMQGVLETENSVANYAYEKFMKPLLAIMDANKNNPAKISEEDSRKILDLLLSLSFLYIEYLYLRVNDLSIGGKMVDRIQGFSKGNGFDPGLLKKLNMDYGSRALVLRMVLDKAGLPVLSYPVFDETNLNHQ